MNTDTNTSQEPTQEQLDVISQLLSEVAIAQSTREENLSVDQSDIASAYGYTSIDEYEAAQFNDWMEFQENVEHRISN